MGLPVVGGLFGALLLAGQGVPGSDRIAGWDLAGVTALLQWPGFAHAAALSLLTGGIAALVSLILAGLVVLAGGRALGRLGFSWLGPVLAMPHAAMAFGVAFLLAPSGWIVRLISPWLTGWSTPPDLATIQDPWGVALMVALVVKETPFLIATLIAASAQIRAADQLRVTAALGYAPPTAAIKVLLPQLWPRVRLPFLAVLAYGIGNVDAALVLGPTAPPTLAVQALRWARDWDVERWRPAATAGLVLSVLVLVAFLLVGVTERVAAALARPRLVSGERESFARTLVVAALATRLGLPVMAAAAMAVLAVWSLAETWRFPEALPTVGTRAWKDITPRLAAPIATTVALALGVGVVAVGLALASAAVSAHSSRRHSALAPLVWLPLLVPQASFVIGAQAMLVALHLDGRGVAVAWLHVVQAYPYAVLILAGPWRALDPRWQSAAAALGAGPWRRLVAVRLPLMLRPLLLAFAVAMAVSVDQYLTTLAAGGGRIATLATETLALAGGGDRRIAAVHALLQAAPALLGFGVALLVPALVERRRRGMAALA
jgi:putative thiamine transport system permease protein